MRAGNTAPIMAIMILLIREPFGKIRYLIIIGVAVKNARRCCIIVCIKFSDIGFAGI